MAYRREIPRDLFNEANLLKCYGDIYINLETAGVRDVALVGDGAAFDVQQDPGSGDLYLANVKLMVRGKAYRPSRPSNSRRAWPLYILDDDGEDIEVFADDGSFSSEMLAFLRGEAG